MAQTTGDRLFRLSCPNCGAAIAEEVAPRQVLTCAYCGASFRVPSSLTPEPAGCG
jgi:hypothetical protein